MIEFLISRLGIILTSGCGNVEVEHEEDSRRRWRRASVFVGLLVARKLEKSLCLSCVDDFSWQALNYFGGKLYYQAAVYLTR